VGRTRVIVPKRQILRPRDEALAWPNGLSQTLRRQERRRPSFSKFWLSDFVPKGCQTMAEYSVGDAKVRVVHDDREMRTHYLLAPWEHSLNPDLANLVSAVIEAVSSHPLVALDVSQEELREEVGEIALAEANRVAKDRRLALTLSVDGHARAIDQVAKCVVRNTVGYGLFETLLEDEHVEDVYVDAPASRNLVHVTLNGLRGRGSMVRATSNIMASDAEVNSLVSRIRYYSGRPFSRACPVLEADLGGLNSRATVIGPPLSADGVAIALRRHSRSPWTLTRLATMGTIDPFTAGLLSFLVDGRTTMLFCGPRGAGKSALLSATMFEFPVSHRILVIEDTPELPVGAMQALGYKVQSLIVQPSVGEDAESKSQDALRVSLRLGESAIIMGEVRGREARTLYDGMRTGKAGSSVLGTIHGDSPESVRERLVNEMGIPAREFLATDIIVCIGLHRHRGSQTPERKVLQIAETPTEEGGDFNVLAGFDTRTGKLVESMSSPSRVLSRIAESWNMTYLEALQNIQTRVEMREMLIGAAAKSPSVFGPEWVCRANAHFWEGVEKGRSYGEILDGFRALVSP
jgi:type IV secretory pathway ATPase VirB11/archaellum biosynthesis ATPase